MTQSMLDFMGGSWQSFAIDGSTHNSIGNAYEMGSNYSWNNKRIWRWNPSNATPYVKLPDAGDWNIPEGGPIYYMECLHPTTYGIKIYTTNNVFVGEIGPQNSATYNKCIVFLLDRSLELWAMYGVQSDGTAPLNNATGGP